MGEQNVQLVGQVVLHHHAERPHAGSGVEHEPVSARKAQLHARGVPAVLDGVGPGCRRPIPDIPRLGLASALAVLWRAPPRTPPRRRASRRPRRSNGYAVASNERRTPLYAVAMRVLCAGRRSKNAMPAGESRRRIGSPSGVLSCRASPNSPAGISPARRTASRAASPPRRCRRPACHAHPAGTSASPDSTPARGRGSTAAVSRCRPARRVPRL